MYSCIFVLANSSPKSDPQSLKSKRLPAPARERQEASAPRVKPRAARGVASPSLAGRPRAATGTPISVRFSDGRHGRNAGRLSLAFSPRVISHCFGREGAVGRAWEPRREEGEEE